MVTDLDMMAASYGYVHMRVFAVDLEVIFLKCKIREPRVCAILSLGPLH